MAALVLASLMGTPALDCCWSGDAAREHWRKHKAHVFVFFIFLVSNMAAC